MTKDWNEETKRVKEVVQLIQRKQEMIREKSGQLKTGIVGLRKNFWEDVTVNVDEPDDIIETQASIRQQAELLSERERSHGLMSEQLTTLSRLEQRPYFGRIDFIEEAPETNQEEPIYIGIASLQDDAEEEFLVYDWRAPIASMYYDYAPGPAEYETVEGTVSGEITLKRQYIIENGTLQGMFDTGLTIGDQLLQKMLGNRSDTKMKSIVATIQREQNRIIRDEKHRYLIVQGVAGSGKTSAALQRVAYLLYAHRERLNAENMILFSPNPLFNSYVSTVLPELGENNMLQTTFYEYASEHLDEKLRLEDPFQQMEWSLNREDDGEDAVRKAAVQFKATLLFKEMIERFAQKLGQRGMPFNDIRFRGEVLIGSGEMAFQFYKTDNSLSLPNRLERTKDWLLARIDTIEEEAREASWVADEIELLDKEDYLDAYHGLQQQQRFSENTFDDFDREREWLSRTVVAESFKPIRSKIERLDFVDHVAAYRRLFESRSSHFRRLPDQWEAVCRVTIAALNDERCAWEDATPLLYLRGLIKGFSRYNWIRHVFIDEAQDYTPLQFEYMKKIFPRAQMTFLGDVNQAIHAHAESVPSLLATGTGEPDREERVELMTSYRSTKPIVLFTKELIPSASSVLPFERDGERPRLVHAGDKPELNAKIVERISRLKEKGHETIAVLCKTLQESIDVYHGLRERLPVQLLDTETYTFEKGVVVLPAYLAKGIEFDAVIIYDASDLVYRRESERELFYTACTRAMHELIIFYRGKPSRLLENVPSHCYVMEN
ncbi:MAG TPA: RNA polymerase recycling motor HelD [Bacillales bacterium]|nr:RNA polymerase recycling motor HelD [Bacillales bacterium]